MIDYDIDLTKPYSIIGTFGDYVKVEGCSKILYTTDGEFGGTCGIWTVPKELLLTKIQRRALGRTCRLFGNVAAEQQRKDFCAAVIAEHSRQVIYE